jgi:hypothetical protein
MRSPQSLRAWTERLLPAGSPCARAAGGELVRALLPQFTTELAQLARQAERAGTARSTRQYFSRWLDDPQWEPTTLYTGLNRLTRRWLARQAKGGPCPLLLDATPLRNVWIVLQVSVPWQRRALPLYRAVYPASGVDCDQVSALSQALAWLEANLPGPRRRWVLVMDRGFPSNRLVEELKARGWRFVLRVKGNWRMAHAVHTGQLRAAAAAGLVGNLPRLLRDVEFGCEGHARSRRSTANLVWFHGEGHQEPWYLVTSESRATVVVALYRQRMRIEAEFRDLKGPLGLDRLARWLNRDRLARFLAWLAVYEWRLAYLWEAHELAELAGAYRFKGGLSWIRLTREWVQRQLRLEAGRAPACL